MTLILKDPAARLDYAIDWAADYLEGELLADSQWTIAPNRDGGLVVAMHSHDAQESRVTVDGGQAGQVYRLANHVMTDAGRLDTRSITVRVEAR